MSLTRGRVVLALYVVAGAVYVTLGVFFPRVLLSWVEGAAFLLVAVWALPALVLYVLRR
jgi:putative Ca2+/H+ antiporter (TMEM165/GDT1 family)